MHHKNHCSLRKLFLFVVCIPMAHFANARFEKQYFFSSGSMIYKAGQGAKEKTFFKATFPCWADPVELVQTKINVARTEEKKAVDHKIGVALLLQADSFHERCKGVKTKEYELKHNLKSTVESEFLGFTLMQTKFVEEDEEEGFGDSGPGEGGNGKKDND